MFRRILLLTLAAFLALMPVTTAYAGDGGNDRDVNGFGFNLGNLEENDFNVNFAFRPFLFPRAEIEIAPGVEIEVPFFTGLGFMLRRNLGALGLFNARRAFGLQNR